MMSRRDVVSILVCSRVVKRASMVDRLKTVVTQIRSRDAGTDVMPPHAHAAPVGFCPPALMWFGMMAAMMAPTAWPRSTSSPRASAPV